MKQLFEKAWSIGSGGKEGGFERVSMMDEDDDDEMFDEEKGDDYRERAAWQSKFETPTCFGCGSTFNPITNRHHHCRECGRVVCGACSEHKDKVKGYSKPQRTCDECHEKIGNAVDFNKIMYAICPCFKFIKRELRKAKHAQVLSEGAVFVRKTSSLRKTVSNKLVGFFGGLAGTGDEQQASSSRVRVWQKDSGALGISPVTGSSSSSVPDELIYLHELSSVESSGPRGLSLKDSSGNSVFEGDLVDSKTRDAWHTALEVAIKEAASKPHPPKVETPAGRVATAARRAKKEIELQSRKRDAEKKKNDYLNSVGGGLKYTALAMADRSSPTTTTTSKNLA